MDVYVRISGHISAHNGTYLARILARKIAVRFRSDSAAGSCSVQCCTRLLNPIPASARRFLRFIYCFSSRPLRRHGRQRAPPQQQSSSSRRPLWRRRRPCVDSTGSFGCSATVRRPAAGGCRGSAGCQYPAGRRRCRGCKCPPPPPPPGRRVGAVVASTTGLVSRMQRRAGSRRRPAAPAQANCVSIG